MATLSCGHVVRGDGQCIHRTFGHNGPCDLEKKNLVRLLCFHLCLDNSKGLTVFTGALSHPYETLQ